MAVTEEGAAYPAGLSSADLSRGVLQGLAGELNSNSVKAEQKTKHRTEKQHGVLCDYTGVESISS
jgi:hypothetical protein